MNGHGFKFKWLPRKVTDMNTLSLLHYKKASTPGTEKKTKLDKRISYTTSAH
jgi:hypothetical protein